MSGLDDFYFLFNKITQLSFRNVLFLKIDTVLILAKLPQNIYDDLIRESFFWYYVISDMEDGGEVMSTLGTYN